MSAKEISKAVSDEFWISVQPVTIYSWAKKYDWDDAKKVVKTTALAKATESEAGRLLRTTQDHLKLYSKIREKANNGLDSIPFDSAIDAVKAAKIGADGEIEILKSMMQMEFVQQVMEILVDEIQDSQTLSVVGNKLMALVVENE
jgi:hypothetical protein|tara:strand:- start:121 stop:555 length:435 start_codon:yes stop_codon:yes gene_type:complete